ncbi:MAG: uncharacterized protein JWM40_209 [Frankiales bacterium]|nr:uncharacterized protein [Frankiales bacterium]
MTVALTETAPRPPLRLVPAPVSAPPYDDEPGVRPVLRLVPSLPASAAPSRPIPFDHDEWLASTRTPTSQLPGAEAMARTLVQALLEVRAGVRPLQQLRRDTTPEVFTALRTTIVIRPRQTGARPDRAAIRALHVQQEADGVAEVCATVRQGTRFAALALRLEGMDGRWRCTELCGA